MFRLPAAVLLFLSSANALELETPVPALIDPGSAAFEITVRDEPGARIWFAASAGTLAPVEPNDSTLPVTVADAQGRAAFRFAPPANAGPVTLDFAVDQTETRRTVALTVSDQAPALTADGAWAAVEELVPDHARLHGPWLMPRGTDVQPAGPVSPFERGLPLALPELSWLFWIDEQPGSRFEHPTRIVVVPASSDAALAPEPRVIYSDWWPLVRTPLESELVSLGGAGLEIPNPGRNRIIGAVDDAPPDACAVLAGGGFLPGAADDVGDEVQRLAEARAVNSMRVFQSNPPFASPEELSRMLARAQDEGCRPLYLSLSAHGSSVDGGSILMADGEFLRYESLVEMLRGFPELDLRLRIAAPGAEEVASWLDGQGFTGASEVENGVSGLFTSNGFFESASPGEAVTPDGPRRMIAPPVDIYAEGGRQRVVLKRPEAVGLGSNFILNFDVADEILAGGQTGVVFLPSDQDALRYSFGGRRQGVTTYRLASNDNTGQVYQGDGVIQIGSIRAEPRIVGLTVGERPTTSVSLERFGFALRRPTTIRILPRDPSVVTATPELHMEAGESEARFDVEALSVGRTEIDLYDSASRSVYTVEAIVDGALPCPASGQAALVYTVTADGDPGDNRGRLSLNQATVWWRIEDNTIFFSGSRNEAIPMSGPIDDGCRFAALGSSGQARVGGFQGVTARATNGRLAGGRLSFTYEVGAGGELPGGQSVTYAVDGPAEGFAVDTVSPLYFDLGTAGGFRSAAVSAPAGWTAETEADWIAISEQGGGELRFLVRPNSGFESRAAEILVAGERIIVTQASGPDLITPLLTSVGNAANFQEGITAGGWLTAGGFGLADRTAIWFDGTAPTTELPESLGGTSIRINGRSAYPSFVSGRQINALAPEDATVGRVAVEVTSPGGVGDPMFVYKRDLAPELFRFTPREGRYAATVAADGALVGPERLFRTIATRPARPGEVVLLFGTGMGQTDPATAIDQLVTEPRPLAMPPVVRIGGRPARVFFAGIVSSGLVQLNIEIPDGLTPGDHRLEVFVDGRPLEDHAELTIGE